MLNGRNKLSLALSLALCATLSAWSFAAAAAPAKPGAYTVDPVHSFVIFKTQHFGVGRVYGSFKETNGKFTLDADPTKNTLELSIKTSSVDTHDAKRDAHLSSPDFFNAAQFPTITFKSTKIAKAADGTLDVTGDLTIRGKTKSITAKVTPIGGGEDPMKTYRAGFEGHATVKRSDFDVNFMPALIGDEVEVNLALEGTAAK